MRPNCCLALIRATLLIAAPLLAAQPSLVRLPAIADASANADAPASNFGAATLVTSGKDFTHTPTFRVWFTRGHYRFDLSSIASLPAPSRVRLRLWEAQSNAAGCLDVTLHRVTQPWSEATLTWTNKPTHDSTVAARACVGNSGDLGWKSFDVTALVQGWLQNTYPNDGLVIRDPRETTAGAARPMHAASREWPTGYERPHLEVAYDTLPFGQGCGPSPTVPNLDLRDGTPALGDTYTLRAKDFARAATLAYLIGVSNTDWNGLPLPYNLGALGFPPACNLLVSGQLTVARTADSRGRAQLSIAVPSDQGLIGANLYHQVVGIDSAFNLALTNGFVVRFF